jgi:hypothetical protein
MKKVSTVAGKQGRNLSQPKLTIGLHLGDRSSWCCVLDEAGAIVQEKKLSTTPKAMKEVLGECRAAASLLRRECGCMEQKSRIYRNST